MAGGRGIGVFWPLLFGFAAGSLVVGIEVVVVMHVEEGEGRAGGEGQEEAEDEADEDCKAELSRWRRM